MTDDCKCCGVSAELHALRTLADRLFLVFSTRAPDHSLSAAQQSSVLRELDALVVAQPDFDPAAVLFQGLGLSDLTIRLGRWSMEQARFVEIVRLAEERLRAAPFVMVRFCNNIRAIIVQMSVVIQRGIASSVLLTQNH